MTDEPEDGEKDYEVGFGRPPKRSQFQPGQSGNPNGRRKGHRNLKTYLLEEANKLITVREGGKEIKVTKLQVSEAHDVTDPGST